MPLVTDRRKGLELWGTAFKDSYAFGEIARAYPDDTPGAYLAVKQGEVFHAMPARKVSNGWEIWPSSWGYVYGPVDPATAYEDVEGATYAYDDGTYWHFAHCSPDEQIDFAADARTFALDQFSIEIDEAHVKVAEASNAPVKAAAVTKVKALIAFTKAVGADVHKRVVGATLGHYHREPHHDHRRELAIAGIDAVLEQWQEAGKTDKATRLDRAAITDTAAAVRTALTSSHTIEWRAAREKRLNDAAAAKGTDPIAGHEYCYTQVATPAVITGEANLPDPAWSFDQLRTGSVVRGSYVYQDAEPTPTAFLPWVIRFKRPVPADVVASQDIGSVPWEQETAYPASTE